MTLIVCFNWGKTRKSVNLQLGGKDQVVDGVHVGEDGDFASHSSPKIGEFVSPKYESVGISFLFTGM